MASRFAAVMGAGLAGLAVGLLLMWLADASSSAPTWTTLAGVVVGFLVPVRAAREG